MQLENTVGILENTVGRLNIWRFYTDADKISIVNRYISILKNHPVFSYIFI